MNKYQGLITELDENEIFVFGSNTEGMHIGGAARQAYDQFGAEMGVSEGMTGQCYAIPTMSLEPSLGRNAFLNKIGKAVRMFETHVRNNPDLDFLITEIGCGIAGYQPQEIAPLFRSMKDLDNVFFSEEFYNIIESS